MKQIKWLDILGEKIKVSFCKMDDRYLGLYYEGDKKIEINKDCPKEKIPETLVHEMFHVAFKRAGLDQTNISSEVQEIIVEQFSKVVCENFRLIKK